MKEDLNRVIADIDALAAKGRKTVRLQLVRDALMAVAADAVSRNAKLEEVHYQFTCENNLAEWREARELDRLLLDAAMTFGGNALRVITWMNGGAAVACLAYAGNVQDKGLLSAMLYFAGGLLGGGMAHGAAYLAQYSYAQGDDQTGNRIRWMCIGLAASAYVLFLVGTVAGYWGLGGAL